MWTRASIRVSFIGIADFLPRGNVLADATAIQGSINFVALHVRLDLAPKALKLLFLVARILKLSLLALIYSGHLFFPGF